MRILSRYFALTFTLLLATLTARGESAFPTPVLLGPTTFSSFAGYGYGEFGYDLVYLQNDVDPNLRRLGTVFCSSSEFAVQSRIQVGDGQATSYNPLPEYSSKSCAESSPYPRRFTKPVTNSEFDLWDYKAITQINRIVYKDVRKFGTLSLQQGHPTETVYVFLPGLYLTGEQFLSRAADVFWKGSNVLLGTFPGHQNRNQPAVENDIGSWLTYTDFLISIAHHYGKKVIVVGQSTGATLAVRAAETGKVDGLILFQPFFGLSKKTAAAIGFGKLLPEPLLDREILGVSNVLDTLKVGIEDQRLLLAPFQKLPPNLPVDLFVDDNDGIVSTTASLQWAKENAPQAKITHHDNGHMFIRNPLYLYSK